MKVKWLFIARMIVNVLALVFLALYALKGGVHFLVLGYVFLGLTLLSVALFWIARSKETRSGGNAEQN